MLFQWVSVDFGTMKNNHSMQSTSVDIFRSLIFIYHAQLSENSLPCRFGVIWDFSFNDPRKKKKMCLVWKKKRQVEIWPSITVSCPTNTFTVLPESFGLMLGFVQLLFFFPFVDIQKCDILSSQRDLNIAPSTGKNWTDLW